MSKLAIEKHLKRGEVYRRQDLEKFSRSIDRELKQLLDKGILEKLYRGLYYYPKISAFGKTPPDETILVQRFLDDTRFLLTTPNNYNMLGVGTTQMYNSRVVYNHKQHGDIQLGGKIFIFQVKHHFPKKLTEEFLLIDLVNNLDTLAEDKEVVLENVFEKVASKDPVKMKKALSLYGNVKTQKLLKPVLELSNDSKLSA